MERIKILGLETLENRRIRGDLIQWYKIKNGIDQVSWLYEPRLGHPRGGEREKKVHTSNR